VRESDRAARDLRHTDPREIAEEIISRSGKFADTAEDGGRVTRSSWSSLTKQFASALPSKTSLSMSIGRSLRIPRSNGAGKTSTVRTLSTLVSPTSGTAQVLGFRSNADRDVEIRHRIAVMTNSWSVLTLSVTENLAFFAVSTATATRNHDRSSTEAVISRHKRVISAAFVQRSCQRVDWLSATQ